MTPRRLAWRRRTRRRTAATVDTAAAQGSQPTDSAPDLAADAPTELTADCTIPPKTISNESEPVDVQCLQQALQREGFYSGALTGELGLRHEFGRRGVAEGS